jgi:hypothetical protein
MCFFPLMAAIFISSSKQEASAPKATISKWLRGTIYQKLGFVNNSHYYQQAKKYKVIQGNNKSLILLPPWHQFVPAVFLRFERSTDRDIGQFLRAIVSAYSILWFLEKCSLNRFIQELETYLLDSAPQNALHLSTDPSLESSNLIIPMTSLPAVISNQANDTQKPPGIPFGGKVSHLPAKFVPLVSAFLKVSGNKLAVPVQSHLVSQALVPGTDLKSLGFSKFKQYLKQAIDAKLVGTEDSGDQSLVYLIGDLERWSPAYVVRHLPPPNKIRSGPYAKVRVFTNMSFVCSNR